MIILEGNGVRITSEEVPPDIMAAALRWVADGIANGDPLYIMEIAAHECSQDVKVVTDKGVLLFAAVIAICRTLREG